MKYYGRCINAAIVLFDIYNVSTYATFRRNQHYVTEKNCIVKIVPTP